MAGGPGGQDILQALGSGVVRALLASPQIEAGGGGEGRIAQVGLFLEQYNGVDIRRLNREESWDFQVYSDAAGGSGFGLYWQGRWCAVEWPEQ